jgi:hypothetical protein
MPAALGRVVRLGAVPSGSYTPAEGSERKGDRSGIRAGPRASLFVLGLLCRPGLPRFPGPHVRKRERFSALAVFVSDSARSPPGRTRPQRDRSGRATGAGSGLVRGLRAAKTPNYFSSFKDRSGDWAVYLGACIMGKVSSVLCVLRERRRGQHNQSGTLSHPARESAKENRQQDHSGRRRVIKTLHGPSQPSLSIRELVSERRVLMLALSFPQSVRNTKPPREGECERKPTAGPLGRGEN